MKKYEGSTGENIKNTIDAYTKLTDIRNQQLNDTRENTNKLHQFENELNENKIKNAEKNKEEIEKLFKTVDDLDKEVVEGEDDSMNAVFNNITKEIEAKKTAKQEMIDESRKFTDEQERLIDEELQKRLKAIDEENEADKKAKEEQIKRAEQWSQGIQQMYGIGC